MKASLMQDPRETDERYRALVLTEWNIQEAALGEISESLDLEGRDHYRVGELHAGITTAPLVAEGSQYDKYAPLPGKNTFLPTFIYKFAFSATEELRRFGRSGQINEYARLMAQIFAHTRKVQIYNVLNRAFNNAFPTAYDSVELIGTHTLANGQTFANELNTPADLTEATLEALIELHMRMPNEDGVIIGDMPTVLAASASQWGTLMRLTQSTTTTLQPSGSSGNAINAVTRAYNIRPHASALILDDDATFVFGQRSPIKTLVAAAPQVRPVYVDPETDDWVWRAKGQWNVAPTSWRGIVGTEGG
jgi:hypothetical protein